jgi:hypothetical protein
MALELPEWQVRAYAENVHHLAQEMQEKVAGRTREEARAAERIGFDRLGAMEGEEPTSRLAPTPNHQADHSRRWVFPKPWVFAHQTDDIEKLRQIHNPTHEYSIAGAAALNRVRTRRLIAALRGSAPEGEGTPTTVALPAAQKIAHATTRLTQPKVLQARAMLDAATGGERDMMGPYYILYTADDLRTLLKDPLVVSADYVTQKALMDGKPPAGYLGFEWIQTSQLPVVAGTPTQRFTVAWAKMGAGYGRNTAGKYEDIGSRRDLSMAEQIFLRDMFDYVRIDDLLVVEIAVDTTAAY